MCAPLLIDLVMVIQKEQFSLHLPTFLLSSGTLRLSVLDACLDDLNLQPIHFLLLLPYPGFLGLPAITATLQWHHKEKETVCKLIGLIDYYLKSEL